MVKPFLVGTPLLRCPKTHIPGHPRTGVPTIKIMWLSNRSNRRLRMPTHQTRSQALRWGAMGAPPVAESSDLSEWQRSVCNAAALSARRTPGTATGEHLCTHAQNKTLCLCQLRTQCFLSKRHIFFRYCSNNRNLHQVNNMIY